MESKQADQALRQDAVTLSGSSKPASTSPETLRKWAEQSQNSGIRSAVIIGGGPAGLAAAIALTKKDVKVTVLEMRADEKGEKPLHSRPHQISLRQDSLESMKDLGAYEQLIADSGWATKERKVVDDGVQRQVKEKVPQADTSRRDLSFIHPGMLEMDSVSLVRISDAEKALYKQAQKLGIEVKAGYTAELNKSGDSYSVKAEKVKVENGQPVKLGKSEDLGVPDLVVVADGAGSPTRAALGVEVLEESAPRHYLGGHIQKGIGATTTKVESRESEGFTRHVMGTGHEKYDQTWVSVEITKDEAALSAQKRTELLAEKAQLVFPDQKVGVEDVGWGAGQITTVQNRRAETNTVGKNVVFTGDAAGTGSVWVGGGLNLALTTHLRALETLVDSSRISGRQAEGNMKIYDKTLQWATSRWHKAGADQLGPKNPESKGA